ncbi:MAG: endolytic transglycosylase MltG [Bacteroidetes bacterium]|nr:endolytic transglycosylase MltG [Bacteroidota bacterium]
MAKTSKKKKSGKSSILKYFIVAILVLILLFGGLFWWIVYKPNLITTKSKQYFYIRTNDTYEDIEKNLKPILGSLQTFHWLSVYMKYTDNFKPGKYALSKQMNNLSLIRLLRSGKQEPVKLVIRTYSQMEDVAHVVGRNLEADSLDFIQQINNDEVLNKIGFDKETNLCFVLPNTYYFNWNSNSDTVINRLSAEYKKFWTDDRKHQAEMIGLTPKQVIILASIVWREIMHSDEMKRVAGVYLNRLKKNMLLQADPTVKFALKEFDLRRILNTHLETESPYNTYRNSGLPPGPICNPPASAIDAVLNAENHDYLYFCAEPSNTGYHKFASTLKEHNANAAIFHKYLNSLR